MESYELLEMRSRKRLGDDAAIELRGWCQGDVLRGIDLDLGRRRYDGRRATCEALGVCLVCAFEDGLYPVRRARSSQVEDVRACWGA